MALKARRNTVKLQDVIKETMNLLLLLNWTTTLFSFQYQGEARPQLKEQYNQHMMEAAFKKNPQNLAFYLATMGSAAGSAGYPSWAPGSPQTAVPSRPQAAGWSMPQAAGWSRHYEYNPNAFTSASDTAANNAGQDTNFEGKDGEPVNSSSTLSTTMVHNTSQ